MAQEQQGDCIQLQHNAQNIFDESPPMSMHQHVMNLVAASLNKRFARLPVLPHTQALFSRMSGHVSFIKGLKEKDESPRPLPTTQCVWIPHGPTTNIVRLVGTLKNKDEVAGQLIVSSVPIDSALINEKTSCAQICANKLAQSCMCIAPQTQTSNFDVKDNAVVYVTPGLDGGKKFVTTINGNVGFRVFGLFTDVMHRGSRISIKRIAPSEPWHFPFYGMTERTTREVLVDHLRAEDQKGEKKVNLVLKRNDENTESSVVLSAMPLVGDDETVQESEVQHCTIDETADQCTVYVRDIFDYNVRLENVGKEFADLQMFTVDIDGNADPFAVDVELVGQMKTIDEPLTTEQDKQTSMTASKPFHVAFVFIGVVVFGVLLVNIISLYRKLSKMCKRRSEQSEPEQNVGESQGLQTPYISMNDNMSYQVFSVPENSSVSPI